MTLSVRLQLKEKDHFLFNFLVFYYWVVFSFVSYANGPNDINPYDGTGYRYYLLIIPLIAYVFLNIKVFFKLRFEKKIIWLILYAVIVSLLSLARMDPKTVMNVLALTLPLIIVATIRPAINIKLVNILFLMSIGIVIILHENGVSKYGYLPGQTIGSLQEGLWWRTSIWEYCTPPFSAVFAIIVLVANFFYNPGRSRYLFYILALYFIVFSGSRIGLVVIFIGCMFILLTHIIKFRPRPFFKVFPGICLGLYYLMLFFPIIITFVSIDNEFINSFLFRQLEGYEELQEQIARPMIITSQIKIFTDNYMIGTGTDNLTDQYKSLTAGTSVDGTIGSDTLITYLLARDGLAIIPLIFFISSLFFEAAQRRDIVMYLMILIVIFYASSYGGFLNFMSPMFLMLFGLLYQGYHRQIIVR